MTGSSSPHSCVQQYMISLSIPDRRAWFECKLIPAICQFFALALSTHQLLSTTHGALGIHIYDSTIQQLSFGYPVRPPFPSTSPWSYPNIAPAHNNPPSPPRHQSPLHKA